MKETVRRLGRRSSVRWVGSLGIFGLSVATVAKSATGGGDFRLSLWFPGQALIHGRDPYDIGSFQKYYGVHQVEAFSKGWFPLYGPIHLWVAGFLALFPVKVAAGMWFVASLAGLVAIGAIVAKALDRRIGWPGILTVTGFLVLARPGRATLQDGQVTVLYVLLSYVAWSEFRKRPWVAAAALACALGKPPFGLPLLAFMVARRLWPVVVRGVGIFVVASVPIVIWLSVNAGSVAALGHAMAHNLSYSDTNKLDAPGSPGRIDALSLVARYWHRSFGGGAEVAAFVVIVGVAALVIGRRAEGPGWPLSPAVLVVLGVATMLCVANEYYDLLLLAWPLAAAVAEPVGRLTTRLGLFDDDSGAAGRADRPGVGDGEGAVRARQWGLVLALTALPALVVSVIPSNDTLKLLGQTSGTSGISTITTVCLLVALAGALVVLGCDRSPALSGGDQTVAEADYASVPSMIL